jgi:hypothetical protein
MRIDGGDADAVAGQRLEDVGVDRRELLRDVNDPRLAGGQAQSFDDARVRAGADAGDRQAADIRSNIVSMWMKSAPPSAIADTCSANASTSAERSTSPVASRRPLGPTEPATSADSLAASTARRAPRRFTSRTRSPRPCSSSAKRLPWNVLVCMAPAPAST